MENQHKLIKGYRDLSQDEIDMMNRVKELQQEVGQLLNELEVHPSTDKRWCSIAKTDLQKGFMSLVRSVAKPIGF